MSACVWGQGEVGAESVEGRRVAVRDRRTAETSRFPFLKKEYQLNTFLAHVWRSFIDDTVYHSHCDGHRGCVGAVSCSGTSSVATWYLTDHSGTLTGYDPLFP